MKTIGGRYVRKDDFHNSPEFKRIARHIDACLSLIERLVNFNRKCEEEVKQELNVEDYIIDYRIEQFKLYHEMLSAIYYSCYSLKDVYKISTMMNFRKIDTTIGRTLINQQRFISFTAIVRMSSLFESARKEYEKTIENCKGTNYFEKLKSKYPEQGNSLELLNHLRNTIHRNGIWNGSKPLKYRLRSGEITINKGKPFIMDNWGLFRIVHDCIELHKFLALENRPNLLRETRLTVDGQRLVVAKPDIDFQKLLQSLSDSVSL